MVMSSSRLALLRTLCNTSVIILHETDDWVIDSDDTLGHQLQNKIWAPIALCCLAEVVLY